MDFEDLTLGATYHVGDTFITTGVPVYVKDFMGGGNFAKTENGGRAGGSGKEINVNNVNLDFGFDVPTSGFSLLFGEYGGNLNIEINHTACSKTSKIFLRSTETPSAVFMSLLLTVLVTTWEVSI